MLQLCDDAPEAPALNDGGYGAESHKFRATGGHPNHAIHGRGDLAEVARGFGLNGAKVTEMGRFESLLREVYGHELPHTGP